MPKQVLAEDIESFLATLGGVASARLLTGSGGEVEQVYVTAQEGAEPRAARRAVVAALMSRYGISVDPWRVQVAHVKGFAPSELPRLTCVSLEETLSDDEAAVRVQVGWDLGGERRSATGQARGPAGPAHRLRAAAAAAIDAARGVLEPPHRRIALHHAGAITCMDRPLVLVGITAMGPAGQDAFVGTAFQHGGEARAAVAASLDAVTKWLLRAAAPDYGPAVPDRRAQLEALRHLVRSRAPSVAGGAGPEAGRSAVEAAPRADAVATLEDIRPQEEGGAPMTAQQETRAVASRPGRPMFEDEFFQPLIADRAAVRIRCRDGYEIPRAVVREVGTYTVLVDADGPELVYKHAIISIRPLGARG